MIRVMDCLGLAGGPALGAVQAGFELAGVKTLDGFGTRNLLANRALLPGPWAVEQDKEGRWAPAAASFVFGCPPCAGFSSVNRSRNANFRGIGAPINHCMEKLVRYAGTCSGEDGRPGPEVVAFESVQAAGLVGRPFMRELADGLRQATGQAYTLTHVFMSGASVGAAQVRKRYFWVAHRVPFGIESPRPQGVATARDAIGDLVGLDPGIREWQPIITAPSPWAARLRSASGGTDSHFRMQTGETGRLEALARGGWQVGRPVPTDVWPKEGRPMSGFNNKYRRIRPDYAAWVLTGFCGVEYVHWTEDRTLTVREAGRLMGFPDNWTWSGARSASEAFHWAGKQVPVDSTRWLAGWVRRALEGRPGRWTGEAVGEAERLVDVTYDYKTVYDERTGERRDTRNEVWKLSMAARPA